MRKYLLMVLAGVLCVGNLYALSVDTDEKPQVRKVETQKYQPAARDSSKPAPSAATFKPTEKISADSAVSFPVDI
jgi:hypothetical protein